MASADPSSDGPGFNALFFGYLFVAGVVSAFFLLYFNRIFASLVSCAIRTYTWRQHRIYLDFQALQISLLGGRIFFTGLRYHGPNESILVQNGHITWCYWLRRVRDVNITTSSDPSHCPSSSQKLPCRINVSLLGLEWFIYNRSPAYDSVLAGLDHAFDNTHVSGGDRRDREDGGGHERYGGRDEDKDGDALRRRRTTPLDPSGDSASGSVQHQDLRSRKRHTGSDNRKASVQSSGTDEARTRSAHGPATDEPSLPMMLQLFPIHIECSKAALVMGSENTRAVLIVKAALISGEIDAADAQGPDPYKQIIRLNFNHPVIQMRENLDFKEDQADRAAQERQVAQDPLPLSSWSFFHRQRRRAMSQLRNIVPYWRRSVESFSINSPRGPGTAGSHVPGSHHWQGLSRYLHGDADDERARWAAVEYAAIPTLLDSPEALLTVAWDVVGKVGAARGARLANEASLPQHNNNNNNNNNDNINGDEPPEWTIALSIKGGTVNYGPWADRQRADLQRYFVPSLCKDAVPAVRLTPGEWRTATQFKLYIELEDEVTIRVPVREESKNWRWKGKVPDQGPLQRRGRDGRKSRTRPKKPSQPSTMNQRSYGWFDIKVAANATMTYAMDMVAGLSGYSNTLNLDLPSTAISSSINHEVLWRCQRTKMSCDLSVPLRWNGLRKWHFGIASNDLELFLLRDHIFLLTDLVDDWGTGPPPDYLVFTPFRYYMDLQLQNLKLYLNLNDCNIIDNPADLQGNTYFLVASPSLQSSVCIPIDSYRPSKNAISFGVHADIVSVDLHLPPWNTDAAFLSSREVGRLKNLAVDGSYNYNASTAPGNTDTLILNVGAQLPVLYLYGFVVRSFLNVKDNYFGDDIHFRTLEEYQDSLRLKETSPEADAASKPPPKKANEMDVILTLRIDDITAMLPASLYSSDRYVQIDTASVALDLRSTSYYMDLDLTLAPLNMSLGDSESSGAENPIRTPPPSTQIFIDGATVYGHRLFGLPPTEPTYLCNWDISLGAITGECTPGILTALMNGLRCFGFTFDDDENALIPFSAIVVYDITFLRVLVQSLSLCIHADEGAFFLSTGTVDVKHNDWARTHYSKRTDISVPDIKLSCVNAELASRHKSRFSHPVKPDAMVRTSLRLALVGRKHDFSRERKIQQDLVRRHDQRTHRTPWLLAPGVPSDEENSVPNPIAPPAQSIPPMPSPATRHGMQADERSLTSRATSRRSRVLRTQSSFLSFSTNSSQRSVVRPRSSRRSSLKMRRSHHLQPLSAIDTHSPSGNGRPPASPRDPSAGSTGHSAFHSAYTEHWDRLDHNSATFSSPYSAPYFPLENIVSGVSDVAMPGIGHDKHEIPEDAEINFYLEDVDPDMLSEECAYSSMLLEMSSGLTGFFTPASLRYAVLLLSALQPSSPDDILDTLHVGCMQDIFGMQKDQKMKGRIQDVMVRLPRADIRFINPAETTNSPNMPLEGQEDQFRVSIIGLALASRSDTRWQDAFDMETRKSKNSFHLRLGQLMVSAAEKSDGMDVSQAPLLAQIDKLVVSSGTKDIGYAEVDAGSVRATVSASQIDYLAALTQRTDALVTDLAKSFSDVFSTEARHARNLVRRLMLGREDVPDPSFLIRPPAVLRSAPQHLRTFDSWKLMMRVRQMWSTQNPKVKEQLKFDGLPPSDISDGQLRRDVLDAFEKWRSWDLDNASESVFLTRIFGQSERTISPRSDNRPMLAVAWIRQGQFVLDPGPKQNEISFVDLSARFENRPSTPNSDAAGAMVVPLEDPMTIIAVSCAKSSISLNWELCELVGGVTRLFNNFHTNTSRSDSTSRAPAFKSTRQPRTIHCVVTLEKGSIDLEAINLTSNSLAYGLKSSVLLRLGAQGLLDSNYVFSCDSATTSLESHSQILANFDIDQPSVFVSHELHATQTTDRHTIKATASSKYLSLVVKLDPINLTEVLDLIIRDEVAQLYQMKAQLPVTSSASRESKKAADPLSAFRVNLAIFMDRYTISLPLLRSLTYTINGTVARAAMAANFGREIIFDFDVKENSHDMRINVNHVARSISLLQIPPTNGRVVSRMDQAEHSISVFASLELVQLDASAVYSLLSALNRPEVTNTINELQQQFKTVQEHMQDIFGPAKASEPARKGEQAQPSSSTLVYAAHLTFAGLEVFGTSPLEPAEYPSLARISFALGSVHLEMTNRVESHGPTLQFPHIHAHLRHITFEVLKGMSPEKFKSSGNLEFGALITASSQPAEDGKEKRFLNVKSDAFEANLSPDTVSTLVDVLGYMGHKIRDLDTSREVEYIRKLRQSKPRITINDEAERADKGDIIDAFLSSITYTFEICNIRMAWLVNKANEPSSLGKEDLVLSLKRIEFGTRSRQSARLTVENTQLQMVAPGNDISVRSANSALLPEVIFNVAYVSTDEARRLAFQAVGKSLDLRLTSTFIIPAAHLLDSIRLSLQNVQQASQNWNPIITNEPPVRPESPPAQPDNPPPQQRTKTGLSSKRLESLLVDADFAGAVVHLTTGRRSPDAGGSSASPATAGRSNLPGRFGQFSQDDPATGSKTVLRSPGLAFKMELHDDGKNDPSLHGEVKVDASNNTLHPSVVPLIMDISNSIKEAVSSRGEQEVPMARALQQQLSVGAAGNSTSNRAGGVEVEKAGIEPILKTADPTAVLGRMKLNLGLRICRQDFSLSCQPIARVAATAGFDSIYITANTVRVLATADRPDSVQSNFFAISAVSTDLRASVQHVYSRESTGSFRVKRITLSLMNSRHVSGVSGVSAILKFSPMQVTINAKQMQDFLLFREIWLPRDMNPSTPTPATVVQKVPPSAETSNLSTSTSSTSTSSPQQPGDLLQRYQQVAATAAFPWTATISITALEIVLDLGQALGKSAFAIEEFWVQSKKSSDWEQNLCTGFRRIGVESRGRMSGFVTMQDFKLRSSIQWPEREAALMRTPSIQASIDLSQFRMKAAFDYQAFLAADITKLEFLMFNVRRSRREGPSVAGGIGEAGRSGGGHEKKKKGDRLVAMLDGDAVQVFGTTTSAAQAIALYQAVQRLAQERRANFETSLREIERFITRRNSASGSSPASVAGLGRWHGSRLGRGMAASGDTVQSGSASHDGMGQTDRAEPGTAKGRVPPSVEGPADQLAAQSTTPAAQVPAEDGLAKSPISLDTDVVVTLKTLNLGVFPSKFTDHQVFKVEALNAQARFAASIVEGRAGVHLAASQEPEQHGQKRLRIRSILGLTLGQLRIGLAVVRTQAPTPITDASSGGQAPSTSTSAVNAQVKEDNDEAAKADGDDKGSGGNAAKEASTAASMGTRKITRTATSSELSVEEVVQRATGSRGGTILKVPQVEAVMQTWQMASPSPSSSSSHAAPPAANAAADDPRRIDYIFKSAFEGKVEVGWNYSRISFIRGMWADHSRTLAQAWGRELPAVLTGASIRVTQVPEEDRAGDAAKDDKKKKGHKQESSSDPTASGGRSRSSDGRELLDSSSTQPPDHSRATNRITAEVQVPQSRYVYNALEPPVIETPQLRDMGEATPPLEWIGLHRDRLPNLTHQIVIVALLELAGEVEDAYSRILGSS